MAALLASALAGLLVAASFGGRYALAAGVALIQVLLLVGMARSTDVPAARTSAVVALVAGLAASGLLLVEDVAEFDIDALTPVLAVLGVGFVVMIVVQLFRRDGRERLTASLTLGIMMLTLAVSASLWLALGGDDRGQAVLLLGLTGAAVGAAIMIFPGPALLWVAGGTIGAVSVGVILRDYAPQITDAGLGLAGTSLVAGAGGLAAAIGVWTARLIRDDRPLGRHSAGAHRARSSLAHALTVAGLSLALAAPATFTAAWAVAEAVVS